MESIERLLNTMNINAILVIALVIIAVIAVIWMYFWFQKTKECKKILNSINEKVETYGKDDVKSVADNIETAEAPRKDSGKQAEKACVETTENNGSQIESKVEEAEKEEACTMEVNSDEADDDEECAVDVFAEIRKMLIETEKNPEKAKPVVKEEVSDNVARSGREYTREELEKLIKF